MFIYLIQQEEWERLIQEIRQSDEAYGKHKKP